MKRPTSREVAILQQHAFNQTTFTTYSSGFYDGFSSALESDYVKWLEERVRVLTILVSGTGEGFNPEELKTLSSTTLRKSDE